MIPFLMIVTAITAAAAWFMTYLCLRAKGCNWFMVSGYLTLSKEERARYKAKYDVPAMNRFSGKRAYLPLAVVITLAVPLFIYPVAWYGTIVGILGMAAFVSCLSTLPKLAGNYFEVNKII